MNDPLVVQVKVQDVYDLHRLMRAFATLKDFARTGGSGLAVRKKVAGMTNKELWALHMACQRVGVLQDAVGNVPVTLSLAGSLQPEAGP